MSRRREPSAASAADGRSTLRAFGNALYRPPKDPAARPKRVGEHHDGSFGVYMAHKIQKLRHQNRALVQQHATPADMEMRMSSPSQARGNQARGDEEAAAASTSAQLFHGVCIYVDGYTTPSKEDLRALMLLHGGEFEHYETSRVTHIVATHLANSKLLQLKKMKRPTPVVHPDWIVKSIEAGQLLPLRPYLYSAFEDPTQREVSASLSMSASLSGRSQGSGQALAIPEREEANDSSNKPMAHTRLDSVPELDPRDEDSAVDSDDTGFNDLQELAQDMIAEQGENDAGMPLRSLPGEDSNAHALPPSRYSSTRDGPAFVQHYFAKSRLHHIGSWRTMFQQRASEYSRLYKGPSFARASPTSCDRVILHVDMDCFFVSVAVRGRPEYKNVPVAIAHSGHAGSSDISSCNYIARSRGVHASMFMEAAKECCPDLVVLPYKFDEIARASFQIYEIFFTHTPFVQAVSCDEAYLEFSKDADGEHLARVIREKIEAATGCTASVGISYNILLAKLATRQAKPNGVFRIQSPEHAEPFLQSLKIHDLPGVGRRMNSKLEELGIEDISQLCAISKADLLEHFGKSASEMLHNSARGIDLRPLAIEANMMRKSISAVINFGIRFSSWEDSVVFMQALSDELASRLHTLKVHTKCLTLLLKKRKADAPIEPYKFMGCGSCDDFSKSRILSEPTDSKDVIANVCIELLRRFDFPSNELRGVGIQATKLQSAGGTSNSRSGQLFRTWLDESETSAAPQASTISREVVRPPSITISQLDANVLEELPPSLREEVLAACGQNMTSNAKPPIGSGISRPRGKGKRKLTKSSHVRVEQGHEGPSNDLHDVTAPSVLNDIHMSQVDEEVYRALPMAIRREIDVYAKKATNPREPVRTHRDAHPVAAPAQSVVEAPLETIETLYAAFQGAVERGFEDTSAALDAILSRILVELERRALPEALRMLRYLRRKCSQQSTSDGQASAMLRDGFNQVLSSINQEVRSHYQARFSLQLAAPL